MARWLGFPTSTDASGCDVSGVEEVKPTLDQLRQYAVAVGLIPPDGAPAAEMLDILRRQIMAAWSLLPVDDAHMHPNAARQRVCPVCNQGKTVPELNYVPSPNNRISFRGFSYGVGSQWGIDSLRAAIDRAGQA
jgi:hypothetical protein